VADYINKNILSQAYIHIEPEKLKSEEDLEIFKERIKEFARTRTSFFLSPDVHVEVEFEPGSLKTKVTVMGTILILIQGISNYKNFRDGIQLIYSDTKRLSEYIISESLFKTGTRHHNIIHLEARAGVIGSIQKVINQLERIKRGAEGTMLATDIIDKIKDAKSEINKLLNNISDKGDRNFVNTGLLGLANELPETPKPPKDKTNTSNSVAIYRDERKKLITILNRTPVNK
jgi:hypothetical protein